MRLICEYFVIYDDGERRQLFTIHDVPDESAAVEYIQQFPAIIGDTLEVDDSNVLNSPYLPKNPIRVWGCIDMDDRYRYFYLYSDSVK